MAHSLMKMSPYDPVTMSCKGLKRYMMEILPATDWSHEAIRPALIVILRRLDKTFNKIAKKPEIRVYNFLSFFPQLHPCSELLVFICTCFIVFPPIFREIPIGMLLECF